VWRDDSLKAEMVISYGVETSRASFIKSSSLGWMEPGLAGPGSPHLVASQHPILHRLLTPYSMCLSLAAASGRTTRSSRRWRTSSSRCA
jgi:hypothetical protein